MESDLPNATYQRVCAYTINTTDDKSRICWPFRSTSEHPRYLVGRGARVAQSLFFYYVCCMLLFFLLFCFIANSLPVYDQLISTNVPSIFFYLSNKPKYRQNVKYKGFLLKKKCALFGLNNERCVPKINGELKIPRFS